MKIIFKQLVVLLALLSSNGLFAQDNETREYSRYSLRNSLGNHAVGFPYENAFLAFNPHVSVGAEMGLNNSIKHRMFIASSIGFIRNGVIGNTITSDFDFGYRYTMDRGIYADIALGLGILDQFHPEDIYVRNATDGIYEATGDLGRLSSLVGLKSGIGYDFSRTSHLPFAIGITHNFFIQSSYFDVKLFPIMPQSTTNILFTYKI